MAEDSTTSSKQLKDYQIQSERRLDARLEELSRDMTASFRQLADYQIQTEHKIDTRFDKIERDIAVIKGDIAAVKGDIAVVKENIAVMTTRGDMSALEGRMLDAFKQVLSVIDSRLPPQA